MTRIVFLDRGTMGPGVRLHRPSFAHEWIEYERTAPGQILDRLRDCDIAVSNKVPIRRETIEKLTRLKMIAIPATGYDAFDVEACTERGIVISNVRGYAVNTVPEHAMAMILRLAAFDLRVPQRRHGGKMAGVPAVLLSHPPDQ